MPATQISFAAFALAVQQAASPCTPPVTDTAIAVVAHPLAVDGRECSALEVFVPFSGSNFFELRLDYWGHDLVPDWAGWGMNAPEFVPSGGARTFLSLGCFVVDGYAHSRF